MPPVLVRWSARARRDVRAIQAYIAQGSPLYARHVVQRLFDRADLLVEHPEAGRQVPEYESADVRELVEPPYRIIYRHEPGAAVADVLTVVHGRHLLPERP